MLCKQVHKSRHSFATKHSSHQVRKEGGSEAAQELHYLQAAVDLVAHQAARTAIFTEQMRSGGPAVSGANRPESGTLRARVIEAIQQARGLLCAARHTWSQDAFRITILLALYAGPIKKYCRLLDDQRFFSAPLVYACQAAAETALQAGEIDHMLREFPSLGLGTPTDEASVSQLGQKAKQRGTLDARTDEADDTFASHGMWPGLMRSRW